jgi:hypothetical protein
LDGDNEMKIKKGVWIFIAGLIVGGTIAFWSLLGLQFFIKEATPSAPRIAGIKVPEKTYEIDFSKRYNLTLDLRSGPNTYSDCLIKGFTKSQPESFSRYEYFNAWLVVELPDGRIVYLPPHDVTMIEESKPR